MLSFGRDGDFARIDALCLEGLLIIRKEEGLATAKRAAECAAELVLTECAAGWRN
jgi:hypothetical protein